MKKQAPVLMIALDAAEVTLIERLCQEGELPTLQSLRRRGCFGTLDSSAELFTGGVWQTFYTSKEVAWHGMYNNKMWRHEKMRSEMATDKWLPEKPFWQFLDQEKFRIALVDVPATIAAPKAINGVHLAGWATHETTMRGAWPPLLWKRLENEFGPPILPHEIYRPQSAETLSDVRESLVMATDQMAGISESLLAQGGWDLFFVGLGATHRGGHLLWNLSQIDTGGLSSDSLKALSGSLVDVYRACDSAIARLIGIAPSDAKILLFAVHGMGLEPGWVQRFPEILSMIQRRMNDAPAKMGFLYRLRNRLPWQLVYEISERVPQEVLNWLVTVWSRNMFDWKAARFFPVLSDLPGQVRINLKGREPQGIVAPGEEYDRICEELTRAFLTFRDIETGEPVVSQVYRTDDFIGKDVPYRDRLPDLIVKWGDVSAIHSGGVRSNEYGEIHWNGKGSLRSGRSGNHRGNGWFVAVGDGIASGTRTGDHQTVDLVPTVFEWLGAEADESFQGTPIPALCGQGDPKALSQHLQR